MNSTNIPSPALKPAIAWPQRLAIFTLLFLTLSFICLNYRLQVQLDRQKHLTAEALSTAEQAVERAKQATEALAKAQAKQTP